MSHSSGNDSRPNIVFILSDDHGIWANGCYGNAEIQTPNIDALAETGCRFENAFCASPVCSPSRASFLTGKIPSQHGVHDWIREGNIPPGKEADHPAYPAVPYLEDELGYPTVLAHHGYETAMSGKWHLGDSISPQQGFDHWFVHQKGGGPYYDAPVVRDGEMVREPEYITTAFTDEALSFLDMMAEPFYLSLHYTAPHSPWRADGVARKQHPEAITEQYDDCPFKSCPQEPMHPNATGLTHRSMGDHEALKGYFAAVTAMDREIGRVIDWLEREGIRDETLIIYTSDNGFSCGHHGFWGKGNGTYPMNMFENSVKVPFIASHPGRIPQGTTTEAMINGYDLFPTLLEYANIEQTHSESLPGESFHRVLTGATDSGREQVVAHSEYGTVRMLRTERWKYVHRYPDGPHQLFDLINDPDERENLIDDPDQADRIDTLRRRLVNWFNDQVDQRRDGSRFPVTGKGQLTRIDDEYPGESVFHDINTDN